MQNFSPVGSGHGMGMPDKLSKPGTLLSGILQFAALTPVLQKKLLEEFIGGKDWSLCSQELLNYKAELLLENPVFVQIPTN